MPDSPETFFNKLLSWAGGAGESIITNLVKDYFLYRTRGCGATVRLKEGAWEITFVVPQIYLRNNDYVNFEKYVKPSHNDAVVFLRSNEGIIRGVCVRCAVERFVEQCSIFNVW